MKVAYSTIDEYLHDIGEPQKTMLMAIRSIIKELVPDASESISYGMPAFKYDNKPLAYFGAFTSHVSLFPTSQPIYVMKDSLSGYETSKGTVKFKLDQPLPVDVIRAIIAERKSEIENSQ